MNLKSLLIGSAAALSSVTVANAADAIVAAEPEALEYVRVCDAFGTGFFYIPGTETCLKIGGYARFQIDVNRGTNLPPPNGNNRTSDWDASSRGQVNFDARSETELGTLRSFIDLRFNADDALEPDAGFLYQGFIELGGLRVGKFDNWWDSSLSGETDQINGNFTNGNAVRYVYDSAGFSVGLAVEELEGVVTTLNPNNIGISGHVGYAGEGFTVGLLGSYDTDNEEGAVRGIVTADLGPGRLGLAAVYSSGMGQAYYDNAEWTVAAEYAVSVTDKMRVTPAFQYLDDIDHVNGVDAWRLGLTVDYQITTGLSAKATVNYQDTDGSPDTTSGFLRLDRSF